MKSVISLLLFLAITLQIYAQDEGADTAKSKPQQGKAYNYKGGENNKNFPFIVAMTSVEYDVTINLDDPRVITKYKKVFEKHNLQFTAESWEDVINNLYNNDSEMHHQIITSPQGNVLRIGTGGDEYQKAFLKYMMPLIANTQKLDSFLKSDDE